MELENNTVLIDFYSEHCQPCKKLMADLDDLTKNYNLKIEKLNIYENYDLCEKYNVMTVPTLVLIKNNESHSYIGYKGKEDLKKFLDNNV